MRNLTVVTLAGLVCGALNISAAAHGQEPTPKHVFVVNTGEGSVSLVDIPAMKEIERHKVGPRPYGIAVSQDGRRVAVGVEDEECVKFYSLPDFKLEGKTTIGKMFNDHIVLTKDGKHIVLANFYSDDVVGINMETMKEEWRIKDLSAPHVVRYGPIGKHMFVTCKKASGVAIIDPETRKLVKFYPLTVNPRSLTFSPDESKVYCASHWVNGFFEADFKTGKVSRLIELATPADNTKPQEVTYHGVQAIHDNIVLAANEGRSFLDAVDMQTGKLLDRLMDVSKPCCIEPIPGTNRVMLSNIGDGSLQFVEVSKDGKLKSLGKAMVGKAPKRVAFVPTGSVLKTGALLSGPQPGNKVAVYNCLFINGTHAGKSTCFIEMAGANPVVMVYARSISDSLVRLVRRLDVEVGRRQTDRLGAQVVFLSDEDVLEDQLRQFVKQHSVKNVMLALADSKGPKAWNLAKEADLTVILYKNYTVGANHAFRAGELTERSLYRILADLPLIVEEPRELQPAKEDQKPASPIEKGPADKSLERIEEQITDIQMQIEALRQKRELLRKHSRHIMAELRNARYPGIRQKDFGGHIYSLAFSPDGKLLAIGSEGKGVYLWDMTMRQQAGHLGKDVPRGVPIVAFSPDGKTLAAGCIHGGIILWDVASQKQLHKLGSESSFALAFSPDGKTLVSGDYNGGQLRLWEVKTGTLIRAWHGHNHHITGVSFAADGKSFLSNAFHNPTKVWDVRDANLLSQTKDRLASIVSADGRKLGVSLGSDSLEFWDVTSKRRATWFPGKQVYLSPNEYSRDGQTSYSSMADTTVRLWEVRTGKERCRFEGHLEPVRAISSSPAGRLVVSGCISGEVLFWDVPAHLKELHAIPNSLDEIWESLGNPDASKAYLAHWLLVDNPKQSVPFLQKQLRRVEAPQPEKVTKLFRDLNSDHFPVREQAVKELESLCELVESSLRNVREAQPTLEVHRRVDGILAKINANAVPAKLRRLRAIEVLEHIGTAEASQVLTELARGTPLAWETQEARLALSRLGI